MFEIIRNSDSNLVEKTVRKFGNGKRMEINFFGPNRTVYIHLNDARKGKSVTLSKTEWQEMMDCQTTISYAMSLVETDGISNLEQQEQQQQQQLQQQSQQQQQQQQQQAAGFQFPQEGASGSSQAKRKKN